MNLNTGQARESLKLLGGVLLRSWISWGVTLLKGGKSKFFAKKKLHTFTVSSGVYVSFRFLFSLSGMVNHHWGNVFDDPGLVGDSTCLDVG